MSNTIRRIVTADGRIFTSLPEIKSEAVSHFEAFLNDSHESGTDVTQEEIRDLVDYRCSSADTALLMKPVLEAEIKDILFSMPSNKAPGPDGYPMEFYKAAWPVVGKDVVSAIKSFFIFGFMPHSVNATLLSLVPKSADAEKISDYRLIACCNVIYKVISKILANSLKRLLPSFISSNQSTFVKDRLLMENVLLAYELVKNYHKDSVSARCAVKIDISKAFDLVQWYFMLSILSEMNLPEKFII